MRIRGIMAKNWKLIAISALCVLSLTAMVLALSREPQKAEFTPPPFEPEARVGIPEVPEGHGYQELDVQAFRVALCGEVHVCDAGAEVWFTNPHNNTVWLKLRVLNEAGQIVGETGLLRPGEYVQHVVLKETGPGKPVILKVMAYEPETYHSFGSVELHTCITAE